MAESDVESGTVVSTVGSDRGLRGTLLMAHFDVESSTVIFFLKMVLGMKKE